MTLSEMLPVIQSLPRGEKLRLIQILEQGLACDEDIEFDIANKTLPLWSPHDSYQGAATLLRLLNEEGAAS